ncbi:unnamed protein product [Effrenium voratum]|nr:unnamed protein product [Effrenium voratum]
MMFWQLLLLVPLVASGTRTGIQQLALSTERKIRVRLLLVRHGLSCANVIRHYSELFEVLKHKNFLDAPLCDCGKRRTERAASLLANETVDIVVASNLMRAIETAWIQFGHRPVSVVPSIGEAHHGIAAGMVKLGTFAGVIKGDLDNTARVKEDQLKILRSLHPEINVNYSYRNDSAELSSWEHFEEFLQAKLLPEMVAKDPRKTSFTIGVAAHSIFLRDSVGRRSEVRTLFGTEIRSDRQTICHNQMPGKGSDEHGGKPYNNQILEIFYNYDGGAFTIDPSAGCRTLGSSPELPYGVPGSPQHICEGDIGRCAPVWRELKGKPSLTMEAQSNLPALPMHEQVLDAAARLQRRFTGPTTSETFSMRGDLPQVETVEQKWVDAWNKANKKCASSDVPRSSCEDLPVYPDTSSKAVCDCV